MTAVSADTTPASDSQSSMNDARASKAVAS